MPSPRIFNGNVDIFKWYNIDQSIACWRTVVPVVKVTSGSKAKANLATDVHSTLRLYGYFVDVQLMGVCSA
eukprot:10024346-Alexandrium_andersonii.AAC.1